MPVYIQEAKPPLLVGSVCKEMKHPNHHAAAPALLSNMNFQPQHHNRLAPLEMTASQSNFINTTMKNLRQNELANQTSTKKKRQKLLHHHDDKQLFPHDHQRRTNSNRFNRSVSKDWASIFLDQLSRNDSNVAQIVATSGGLVTYCKFLYGSVLFVVVLLFLPVSFFSVFNLYS